MQKINILLICVLVLSMLQAPVFADEIVTANNFTVRWYNCNYDLTEKSCFVDIQNLEEHNRQFDFSFIISKTNYDTSKQNTQTNIQEWKIMPTPIPIYTTQTITKNCTSYNNQTFLNETFDCSYNQTIQNGTELKNIAQWKDSKSYMSKGIIQKKNHGIINLPKFKSKPTFDDYNNIETQNGIKTFKISWTTPIVYTGSGWGSIGKMAIIDENTQTEYHPWWNLTWQYRKPINITGTGTTLTDYQHLINVSFVTSKMNSDFSDLRFTNSSDIELPYWIENQAASQWATIWVKVDSINATGNTTIYMYYGNTSAVTTTSNIQNTMLFGDNFEYDDAITNHNWSYLQDAAGTTTATSTNTKINLGSRSLLVNGTVGGAYDWFVANITPQTTMVRINYYINSTTAPVASGNTIDGCSNANDFPWVSGAGHCVYATWGISSAYQYSHYNTTNWFTVFSPYTSNTWYKVTQIINLTSNRIEFFIDNVSKLNISCRHTNVGNITYIHFGDASDAAALEKIYLDDIYVTKYTSPEPTFAFGSEEVSNTAPTITLNSPADSSWSTSKTVSFNYTPIDDSGFTNCSIWSNNTGSWTQHQANTTAIVNNSVNTISATFTNDGIYLWAVECYDNGSPALNNFSTTNRTIKIDSTNPSVSITTPTSDGLWYNTAPSIIASCTDTNFVNMTINHTSYTATKTTTPATWTNISAVPQGTNSARITCTDIAGNTGTADRSFNFDDIKPASFNYVSPTETDNANKSQNWYYVNITFTEINPDACLLSVGGSNYTMTKIGTNCYLNRTSQSDDIYTYSVYANDSAGNFGQSASRTIQLDTIKPILILTSPTNTTYNTTILSLNYSVIETNLNTVWYQYNSVNTTITGNTSFTAIAGTSKLILWANDSAGNINSTSVVFTVNVCIDYTLIFYDEKTNVPIYINDYGLGAIVNDITKYYKYHNFSSSSGTPTNPLYACDYYKTTAASLTTATSDIVTCKIGLSTTQTELIYFNLSRSAGGNNSIQLYNYVSGNYDTVYSCADANPQVCSGSFSVNNLDGKYTSNNVGLIRHLNVYTVGHFTTTLYYMFNYNEFNLSSLILQSLNSTTYKITATDTINMYVHRNYYINPNVSHNTTTVYLLKTTDAVYSCYVVASAFGAPITGARLDFYKSINGIDTLIHSQYTDSAGSVWTYLDPYTIYTIKTTASGYGTRTDISQPAPGQCQSILFGSSLTLNYKNYMADVYITISPEKNIWENQNATYIINFTALNSSFSNYGVNITYPNGTVINSTFSASNATSATISISESINYNGSNTLLIYFTKSDMGTVPFMLNFSFYTIDMTVQNYTLYSAIDKFTEGTTGTGLTTLEMGGLFVIVLLFIGGATATFGFMGTVLMFAISSIVVVIGILPFNLFVVLTILISLAYLYLNRRA